MVKTIVLIFTQAIVCNVSINAYGYPNQFFPAVFPGKYVLINPSSSIGRNNQAYYDNLNGKIPLYGKSKENHGEIQGRIKGGVFREKYWSRETSGDFHKNLEGSVVNGKYKGRKDLYKGTVVGKSNGKYYAGTYKGYYKVNFFQGAVKPKGIMRDVIQRLSNPKYRSMQKIAKREHVMFPVNYGHRLIPIKQKGILKSAPRNSSKRKYLSTKRYLRNLNKGKYKYRHDIGLTPSKQRSKYKKTPKITSKERYLAMQRSLQNMNKQRYRPKSMRLDNLKKMKRKIFSSAPGYHSSHRRIFRRPLGTFNPKPAFGNIIYRIRTPKYKYKGIPHVMRQGVLKQKRQKQIKKKIPFNRTHKTKTASGQYSKAKYKAMNRILTRIKNKRRYITSLNNLKGQPFFQPPSSKRFTKRYSKIPKMSKSERRKSTRSGKKGKTERKKKSRLYQHLFKSLNKNKVKKRFMTSSRNQSYGGKKTTPLKIYRGGHRHHDGKHNKNDILRNKRKIKLILL